MRTHFDFHFLPLFLFTLLLLLGQARPDPDPLQDYCVADNKNEFFINGVPCINPEQVSPSHFVTSALSKTGNTSNTFGFSVTATNTVNLPGLNTLGLVLARVDIAANGIVPPHSHPRASEVTTCLKGLLLVGFIDTNNRVFTQNLRPGESFVFPKGLIHFLFNRDTKEPALALSGLNSQNPGSQIASLATFASKPPIPVEILKRAFQISTREVDIIRENLGG
ncbi:germin-like protein subfamily 1 member 1 [Cajanus cajan]|uniref:Germin-like protein n=1 Tax=Cajanus cajan TaxID=3821 RepID=A0A151TFV1_CAJCA|nr:germin-like protein subfamily 1 member 1 [Cajanus cajan]KYP65929.1 Germin-like protein subfamily 1 member 1 [Cajanus cajan]